MSNAKGKQCLWILLLVALVLTVLVATATSLVPMSFDNLTQRATAIVRLRCVSVHSAWADGEIWTESQFEVLEQVKADIYGAAEAGIAGAGSAQPSAVRSDAKRKGQPSAAHITVRQLGGSVGGVRSHVDDVPTFQPGEEVYLFLWRRAGEPYRVLGWTQGTFRIARDARTGAARVTQDSAVAVFDAHTREFQQNGVRNLPLTAFQEKLHQAMAASQH